MENVQIKLKIQSYTQQFPHLKMNLNYRWEALSKCPEKRENLKKSNIDGYIAAMLVVVVYVIICHFKDKEIISEEYVGLRL